MTTFLLDNSVLHRLDRAPAVRAATELLIGRGDLLASSDVSILEAGFSARNAEDHARIRALLGDTFVRLPLSADVGAVALEMQTVLFGQGIGRAVGVMDLLHAATAVVHDAVLVHYDADFEALAGVDARLQQEWIVPRGSVS